MLTFLSWIEDYYTMKNSIGKTIYMCPLMPDFTLNMTQSVFLGFYFIYCNELTFKVKQMY